MWHLRLAITARVQTAQTHSELDMRCKVKVTVWFLIVDILRSENKCPGIQVYQVYQWELIT